jgi:Uma2 family endonuclease
MTSRLYKKSMSTSTLPSALATPARKRWTVPEFHRAWELGFFDGKKAILLDGEIIETPLPGPLHNKGVGKVDYALKRAFAGNFWVRIQLPLELNLWADPVPDVSVVPGTPDDYDVNPATALLVIEVSDTTLAIDTGDKALLYAAAGLADYWVLDLNNRELIVHRDPQPDPAGARYQTIFRVNESGTVTPLTLPGCIIAVGELLPRR